MPPGLTLDPATGKITGAGTAAGRYPFTVTVTDGTGAKASVEWNITILPLLDFRKGKGLPIGHVNRLYSARIPVEREGLEPPPSSRSPARSRPGLELDDTGRLDRHPPQDRQVQDPRVRLLRERRADQQASSRSASARSGHSAPLARPAASGRARMARCTRSAVSSSSPARRSSTPTSVAPSSSSASTARTGPWASCSIASPT